MRILVTGGAGYIGSVVVAHLVEADHDVVVLDDLSTGHRDAVPEGIRFIESDVLDVADHVASKDGFDAVMHFAAKSLVGDSIAKPDLYWRNDVVGSLALLEAMRAATIGRLVFSSSAAVYGEPTTVPIREDAATAPINPYGATKLAVDHLIAGYSKAFNLSAVSLRYFNVAGATRGLGERHPTETHLIPLAIDAAHGHSARVLQVFGSDYSTPDGTCVRDYIHVDDLARAHVLALATWPGEHRIFNLGNGSGFSVQEVINVVERVSGRAVSRIDAPRRAGDPAVLVASSELAAAELGWKPAKPSLEEMVADALDVYRAIKPTGDRVELATGSAAVENSAQRGW